MRDSIRLARATDDDAAQVREIYAPIVEQSPITFEFEVPPVAEMRDRIAHYLKHAPWLVWERDGRVLGYAYASRHRDRAAYQWSVEVSVYVHEDARRAGVARRLYLTLFELLRVQHFQNAYAGITLPNPPSVALHESLGFRPVGVYTKIGHKLGAWHDVGWWQLALGPYPAGVTPPPLLPMARLIESPECTAILARGCGG